MVLARVADYFFPSASSSHPPLSHNEDGREAPPVASHPSASTFSNQVRRTEEELRPDMSSSSSSSSSSKFSSTTTSPTQNVSEDEYEESRPPYLHAMLAGGLGGTIGDMLMHSLDTVKTRQQGDPHLPPKYTSMGTSYWTIMRQEGVGRGLYGGWLPAFIGSFGGTLIFFGCYEGSKRYLIDTAGVAPSVAYFSSGFVADLAASPLYVPTEVLKTRLQLQGRWNNPYFTSGYNYRSTYHALRTIVRTEGLREMFSGYKATLFRDLPFSALQFAFYEQEQKWAKEWAGPGKDIGLAAEILTGATAGGMAGVITCPMDVVKTRVQTELDPEVAAKAREERARKKAAAAAGGGGGGGHTSSSTGKPSSSADPHTASHRPTNHPTTSHPTPTSQHQKLPISTSSPSTTLKQHGQVALDTESVIKALRIIYRTEGLAGWFRGVGPRGVWTSIQSGTMLLVYQKLVKWFEVHPLVGDDGEGVRGYV
ncbi:hypothetical protein KC332_g7375 [Hortaea werneckii]|uniref:Mitochondrial carrier n=1 Tax=Hortaea werneckii EXF-2000 TaxID=1157616 RepID=A0A1Z5T9F0_HORWE|nr:hypothetical protein KC358_g7019 [Hortaea werneckii]OTA32655.1 hypothetical protein BTJ68_07760 [Hortaea werneckii EXF-2000]KAI6835522.1 hypothetical protein KC350_g6488 [Hortaea werneckii]KAI6930982.1 hypothetical protein KC348_g7409 [Hortaea werneckii]KAI6935592.1 hypothetical protein KC341_g6822 [Hortaea werneckii]